jgi:predicted RNA binding protein YcfA (HicA-like mRNA interferase family)
VKYRDFARVLDDFHFTCERTVGTHRQYVGYVDGVRRVVTVDFAQGGEDIMRHNLASMIRQSGLPKRLFR